MPPLLIPPSVRYTGVLVTAPASSVYAPRETLVSRSINFVKKDCWGSADRSQGQAKGRSLDVAQSPEVLKGAEFKADLFRPASLGRDDEMPILVPEV